MIIKIQGPQNRREGEGDSQNDEDKNSRQWLSAAQVETYPRRSEITEDSWRDVSKNNVELLNMCWNILGDVISVWQKFGG